MFEQRRLNFKGGDILASPNDHVLDPVDDVEEAFIVETPNVSRVQPAIGEPLGRLLWSPPVPRNDVRSFDPYLAVSTAGTSLPSRSTIRTSQTGTGTPTLSGRSR